MLNLFNKIKPWNFFVFVALLFEITFNLFTPPLQAPDELNHFYRAYQVADGHFLPERTKDRLGGQIPICFNEFVLPYTFAATNLNYTLTKKDLLNAFDISFSAKETGFKDFPNTAYYSPVSYLPQAFAMAILKQFNCSVATLYYGGRLFTFSFWLLLMYLAIRMIPVYKWLFTLIVLLPMNLYLANSFSADTVTNCLALFFIAFSLKLTFSDSKLTKKDLLFILILACLLALAKLVYIGLIILLFLMPAKKFSNNLQRHATLLLVFAASFLMVFLWSATVMKYYITFSDYNIEHNFAVGLSPCGNYYLQKEFILGHEAYFFKVIFNSIFAHPKTFLMGYIGAFGQSDIALPGVLYIIAYLVIIMVALSEVNEKTFKFSQKIILASAAILSFVLLLLSQHLMWDCVGEGIVDMLQGRYLIPVFPLLFMLMPNTSLKLKLKPALIISSFLILIYFFSFSNIYTRFFKETFIEKIEFYCDAETKDENGYYMTNNKEIKLQGAIDQTADKHHSGSHSILLSPLSPYGFSYQLKNIKAGDMVEMQGWQKGLSGFLAVSSKGKNCKDFFAADKNTVVTDKNGWSKIHCLFTITENCDSTETVIFAWNPGKTKVYFDDIKFKIKRFAHTE
ncbi:MAG: DUF2142 domain-containing protein [Bacteroidetes bacterium]|nr:DUF2142 domain-containing protein [Bacteroidota bacterium]